MSDLEREPRDSPAVLVVDDEQMLGRVIERFLRSDYEVISVTSAKDALAQLEERDDIACILCDLMMPEMTGMDFYGEIETQHPDYTSRVAFLSGGTFTPEASEFISNGGHVVVEKPFRPERLREVVGDLLG
jgi:DNA-binding NtrC family response regulator